ncbi:BatA domain-containing protein [Mucilaginibacter litoreus]|uniref:BatA domain-containing protein n=1 Tax=Mucilaginibacter litoreus TaxID=1048221 RepID=A0ABW3AQI6_9SPHI
MQFLSPIWFFALAALAIPVLIHLWNIRPGKTLKVGSIALITEASKSSRRSFKLLDVVLLLLRCLLLALLAIYLAQPEWQKYISAQKAKGWVLLPKENFKETYQKFKPTVDALSKAGHELHFFNQGFAKTDTGKLPADKDTINDINYWTLIKRLDDSVASNRPVYVFTPNGVQHFVGNKPTVRLNLHWQIYTPADSVSRWIASASFTNTNAIKVVEGNSNPSATTFTTRYIQNGSDAIHNIRVENGRTLISLKNDDNDPVVVDTSTLRIAVYTDQYQLDARYLQAALRAAVSFTGQKVIIKQYNSFNSIPTGQSWLFWLSDKAVTHLLKKSAKTLFRYAPGKVQSVNSWIDPGHQKLYKHIAGRNTGEKVWTDGFGQPVLTKAGNECAFYSRFNPVWSDLVWSDDFPVMILKLLTDTSYNQPSKYERRILTNRQIQPEVVKQFMPKSSLLQSEKADISKYFWLFMVGVFIAERIVAHRRREAISG